MFLGFHSTRSQQEPQLSSRDNFRRPELKKIISACLRSRNPLQLHRYQVGFDPQRLQLQWRRLCLSKACEATTLEQPRANCVSASAGAGGTGLWQCQDPAGIPPDGTTAVRGDAVALPFHGAMRCYVFIVCNIETVLQFCYTVKFELQ
jgi:hypothetical protein